MRKLILTFIILILCLNIYSQDQASVDSLINRLNLRLDDTARINLLNRISDEIFYVNADAVIDYAQEALNLSEGIGYKFGIGQAYINLGIYYRSKGIYDKAIDYFFNSLKIMEQINNIDGIARCYNLFGIIYFYLKNYELSLEYYTKALELNIAQSDKKWAAGNYNNIGMIYEKLGEYSKALDYYLKSLETNIELSNLNWIANNYGNIGSLYQEMGNPKSLEYIMKGLKIEEELGDLDGVAVFKFMVGKYYNSQNEFEKALPFLLESYVLADSINALLNLSNSYGELSNCYAGLGNYKEAFYFHELYKELSDQLNFEENLQKITRLEMQDKFQKDLYLQEISDQKREIMQLLFAAILFIILLAAIILYSRQKAKAKKHQLQQKKLLVDNQLLQDELNSKDKVLQDNIKYLVSKNDLITNVSERLVEASPKFRKENQKIVNEVILELQSSIDSDIWKEFEVRFKQVHGNFYDNLMKQFPHLSLNDQKLCAFLRLKMSSREISSLTDQSISSIETARSRLRKKLAISNKNIELVEFLSQF
ncbi:MAG: tetratricopeptide repeat protein [Bacteroidales bacterium]